MSSSAKPNESAPPTPKRYIRRETDAASGLAHDVTYQEVERVPVAENSPAREAIGRAVQRATPELVKLAQASGGVQLEQAVELFTARICDSLEAEGYAINKKP